MTGLLARRLHCGRPCRPHTPLPGTLRWQCIHLGRLTRTGALTTSEGVEAPLLQEGTAAAAIAKAMPPQRGDTGPPTAGTGAVFPELYDEQLQAKVQRVRELLAEFKVPANIDVYASSPSHFRMRTEFRVWQQADDLYYVMFEKDAPRVDSAGDGDGAVDGGQQGSKGPVVATDAEPEGDDSSISNCGDGKGDGAGGDDPADHLAASDGVANECSGGGDNRDLMINSGKAAAAAAAAATSGGGSGGGGAAATTAVAAAAAAGVLPCKVSSKARRRAKRRAEILAARAAAAARTGRITRVRIDSFPMGSRLICALMPALRLELLGNPVLRERLFQANFHTTLSGEAMVTLTYHKALDDVWEAAARGARTRLTAALQRSSEGSSSSSSGSTLHVIGRSRKQKIVLGADYVTEQMTVAGRVLQYRQVEGAFSQPNGGVCEHMLTWAVEATAGSSDGDLLELYCGNGNFTVAVAPNFRQVIATEVSKASVVAAAANLEANGVTNVRLARMSAEEFTDTWRSRGTRQRLSGLDWDSLRLTTLLVDPPRGGLDAETEALMANFERVVYVSCNPATLAANLRAVAATHDIARLAVFDQFPYTHHIECGVYLVRRSEL